MYSILLSGLITEDAIAFRKYKSGFQSEETCVNFISGMCKVVVVFKPETLLGENVKL